MRPSVILRSGATKNLGGPNSAYQPPRPFAEFILSAAEGLRVTTKRADIVLCEVDRWGRPSVILRSGATKNLGGPNSAYQPPRPFAEFILSAAEGLRVTAGSDR